MRVSFKLAASSEMEWSNSKKGPIFLRAQQTATWRSNKPFSLLFDVFVCILVFVAVFLCGFLVGLAFGCGLLFVLEWKGCCVYCDVWFRPPHFSAGLVLGCLYFWA
jgi:hypothetical protein